jgi:hypothetical protein
MEATTTPPPFVNGAPTVTGGLVTDHLDLGLAVKRGWQLFARDLGPLLIGPIIACLLSVLTLGILAGPLFAGVVNMIVGRVRDGRPARVGDVFSCFDRFVPYFIAALVLALLIGLASITIVGGLFLATIWIYVFPFMVDRGMGFGDALTASKDLVFKRGFWEHLALVLVVIAVCAVTDGILGLIATPLLIAVGVAAYYLADGRGEALERV